MLLGNVSAVYVAMAAVLCRALIASSGDGYRETPAFCFPSLRRIRADCRYTFSFHAGRCLRYIERIVIILSPDIQPLRNQPQLIGRQTSGVSPASVKSAEEARAPGRGVRLHSGERRTPRLDPLLPAPGPKPCDPGRCRADRRTGRGPADREGPRCLSHGPRPRRYRSAGGWKAGSGPQQGCIRINK